MCEMSKKNAILNTLKNYLRYDFLIFIYLYVDSTVYKLCALVDIQNTLIVLCCVPYHQISGSHAFTIALRLRTKLLKQVK